VGHICKLIETFPVPSLHAEYKPNINCIKQKCLDPSSWQTEMVVSPVLPTVTRDGLNETVMKGVK